MKRICTICKKKRRTTNKEIPYCCEPCLRSKGRSLLLNLDEFVEEAKHESMVRTLVCIGIGTVICLVIIFIVSKYI